MMRTIFRDGLEIEVLEPPRILIREGHTCEIFKTKEGTTWFVTLEGAPFCAHGESFKDAVIAAKEKQNPGAGKADAIERVRESSKVNLTDFCLITGACRAGATLWAKQEGLSLKTRLTVKEIIKRLKNSESGSWAGRLKEELDG